MQKILMFFLEFLYIISFKKLLVFKSECITIFVFLTNKLKNLLPNWFMTP